MSISDLCRMTPQTVFTGKDSENLSLLMSLSGFLLLFYWVLEVFLVPEYIISAKNRTIMWSNQTGSFNPVTQRCSTTKQFFT